MIKGEKEENLKELCVMNIIIDTNMKMKGEKQVRMKEIELTILELYILYEIANK